jgi:hypothetical protein
VCKGGKSIPGIEKIPSMEYTMVGVKDETIELFLA